MMAVITYWLTTAFWAVVAVIGLFLVQVIYLALVLAWCERSTSGMNYYGRSAAGRRRFKTSLFWHKMLLAPIVYVLSRLSRFQFAPSTLSFRKMPAPKGSCTEESLQRATEHLPAPHDVFVATQMRCGTTWMQHLVYQVLTRGAGDLVGQGKTLGAVSPWLESYKSVSIDDAPLIGDERPSRIIKTHLPAELCPFNADARYIYVQRDPVSCFSSCVDYVSENVGAFSPGMEAYEEWFTSDEAMWWSTWPRHVGGWLKRAEEHSNVLVVKFEDMVRNLSAVVKAVCNFLSMEPLSREEMTSVVAKCSFEYMRDNSDAFEMTPPHVLQGNRGFFVSGKIDRSGRVPSDVQDRIRDWCNRQRASAPNTSALAKD